MKKLFYTMIAISLLHACVKDDSSDISPKDNPNFSHISITSEIKTLSVDYGQEFVFEPKIEQSVEGKTLEYIWTANQYDPANEGKALGDQIFVQEGMPLKYSFMEMGEYKLRLEVKNEDYSEFKVWNLSVRAYDKGYFVVGTNEAGNTNIAFGRIPSESDIQQGKKLTFVPNIVGDINSEVDIKNFRYLSKAILSYGKSDANLHIFTKDKIYVADPNTFKIFYTAEISSKYPDEYIEKVSIMDTYMTTAVLFTSKGRFLAYNKVELGFYQQGIYENYHFDNAYTNLIYTSGVNMNNGEIGVNEVNSKIYFYVNYAAMLNNTSGSSAENYADNVRPNIYSGYDIISVLRMNGDSFGGTPLNFFAVAQKKSDPKTIKLVEFSTSYSDAFIEVNSENYTSSTPITYRKGMQIVPNARYNMAYYADGNKIYVWYPKNTSPYNRLPEEHTINVGEGKVVTTMSVSYDMKQLYVGFYDNNSINSLKGGFYIYDAKDIGIVQNPQPIETYENITTKPVQILYKSNKWDTYSSI